MRESGGRGRRRAVGWSLLVMTVLVGLSADAWLPVGASSSTGATLDRSEAPVSGSPDVSEAVRLRPGNIFQARIAIRRACRRFYTYGTRTQVTRQCGGNRIGWRSDCYVSRPSHFVPRVGGCAYLRGYLAVYFLPAGVPSPTRSNLFRVGRTRWKIFAESD